MAAPTIDFSFSRYVAARKGQASARAREAAAYAFGGDLRVRSTLDKLKPVTVAVEATVRMWQAVERGRMLGTSVRVTEKQFGRIFNLAARCAETLQIPVPTIYISPEIGSLNAHTFGTTEESFIVINAALVDRLSEPELLAVIGHECGHIQNNHAVYLTTLHFLSRAGNLFLRWTVRPAVLALNAWARRAEITCDRAALLCTRDLDATVAVMMKLALGSERLFKQVDLEEYLAQLEDSLRGPGRFDELFRTHPYVTKRVRALRLFAQTTYYRSVAGLPSDPASLSKEACDAQVSELLAVLR